MVWETLHLRVPRHCENALKVAEYLEHHEKVDWVEYPDEKEQQILSAGTEVYAVRNLRCSLLLPKGEKEGAMRFTNALKLVSIETHVADCHTCVLHPASHTHRQRMRNSFWRQGFCRN